MTNSIPSKGGNTELRCFSSLLQAAMAKSGIPTYPINENLEHIIRRIEEDAYNFGGDHGIESVLTLFSSLVEKLSETLDIYFVSRMEQYEKTKQAASRRTHLYQQKID